MTRGKIKFYDETRGWGFITCDETKEDIFFHHSELKYQPCLMGDKVNFTVKKSLSRPGKFFCSSIQIEE